MELHYFATGTLVMLIAIVALMAWLIDAPRSMAQRSLAISTGILVFIVYVLWVVSYG